MNTTILNSGPVILFYLRELVCKEVYDTENSIIDKKGVTMNYCVDK